MGLEAVCEAEPDGQWSFVEKKSNRRRLWHTHRAQARLTMRPTPLLLMCLANAKMLFLKNQKHCPALSGLPGPSGYTGDWGAYGRHLDVETHEAGKRNTQKIGRKNLNLRTWIKRLARKTICFSKDEVMHGTVIGLLINKVEFGIGIHARIQV